MTETNEPVLVIDTSFGLSIGVVGEEPAHEADSRSHVEKIEPFIAKVLADAKVRPQEVKTVIVGTGPAPFTGLRAGIVSAKAFAFATGATILGQDVLEPQAWWELEQVRESLGEGERRLVLALNDARRKQLYFQLFEISASGVSPLSEMDIQYPATIVERVTECVDARAAELARDRSAAAGRPSAEAEAEDGGEGRRELRATLPVSIVGHGAAKYQAAWDALAVNGVTVDTVVDESVIHAQGSRGLEIFAEVALKKAARGESAPADPLYLRRPDVSVPPPLKPVLKAEQ